MCPFRMFITRLDELCVKLMKLSFLVFIHKRDSAVFDAFVGKFSSFYPVFSCSASPASFVPWP